MRFILGAIAGAAAMWVYGDRLCAYLDTKKEHQPETGQDQAHEI